ncbi:hypothetical protein SOVF_118820 [Spinacia oleracea]|nr:hypothetical protein SOVF_118820 [Spinacia oleracea]
MQKFKIELKKTLFRDENALGDGHDRVVDVAPRFASAAAALLYVVSALLRLLLYMLLFPLPLCTSIGSYEASFKDKSSYRSACFSC